MDVTGPAPWQIWIDTGGTFTDCLARDPGGGLHRAKVLSSSALRATVSRALAPDALRIEEDWGAPQGLVDGFRVRLLGLKHSPARVTTYDLRSGTVYLDRPLAADLPPAGTTVEFLSPEEAPVLAARLVTGTPLGGRLPALSMRLGTTRGTNALLERRGARVALFITRGFGDLLRIGTQQRPELFALRVATREPLYDEVVEVDERLSAGGSVLRPLDPAALAETAAALAAKGIEAAAVALMHAYRNPAHERALEDVLRAAGFRHVSLSSSIAPLIKLLPRAETAVVDAYLSPVVGGYLERVGAALAGGALHVSTSAGGLVRPGDYRAKDSLLSGPAGGVAGAAYAGRRSGCERVIAFDMGGTSTDVARYDGAFEYVWEHEVGGGRIFSPALAIETVAAGGGSICTLQAGGLCVGPESAGAAPGPACYGAGGPLTLTDCNLLLGRSSPARFAIPVQAAPAEHAADALLREVRERTGDGTSREALLAGLIEIADERMADAIRTISLRRGYDPADYALVAFGGAGGQHACGVAERLGVSTILIPPDAGLLSALGIGGAPLERIAERQVLRPLAQAGDVGRLFAELADEAVAQVAREGVVPSEVVVSRRIANLRYAGQEASLAVDWTPGMDLEAAFHARYAAAWGHRPERRAVELESVRAIASTRIAEPEPAEAPERFPAASSGSRRVWLGGAWRKVPCYERSNLLPGASFAGPAVVTEQHGGTLVLPRWSAEVDGAGALVLAAGGEDGLAPAEDEAQTPEAVRLELFVNRYRALVGEMGEMLRRTALSTNVKERLDFSCALLDAGGELVVNAPHIPVHLGALGLCVRSVAAALPLQPGDVAVTNHPAFGGSHLPDVTVITPVHDGAGALLGYVASRAHHAEIGGTRPGSMPPDARTLAEEGVVIPPTLLVRGGEARWGEMRRILTEAPYPTRAVEENLADLAAAVAANHRGAELLREMAKEHGSAAVAGYMDALKHRAEKGVREALAAVGDGVYEAEERLDDGSVLCARIDIAGGGAVIDFAGTADVHPGNLNATPAVVRSVVLYVLRLLVREPLPLNEGLLRAVEVRVPRGMLDPEWPDDPAQAPAVVGGNTEISQRLTDTLLKALRLAACSQGTMNNVLWGTDRFGYYETVCGGAGAGPEWEGAGPVHTHMTNTRITDPEVVEHRYPVRIERFAVRRGSGGAGAHRGGDGAVRETVFLKPMSLSLLAQHRAEGPYGVNGGQPGAPGRQHLVRADGETVALGPVDGCEVHPGDRLVLETPGGGGWGTAAKAD